MASWFWQPWLRRSLAPSATHSAAPQKTVRVTFQAAESGFDPVKVSDYYSGTIIEQIFEPLLTYDYLARPVKLVPNIAENLPAVSDDGKTYTFTLRRGIYFSDDPAFKGQRRELTAHDYAYSIKRFLDPRNRSPYAFLFEGKIVGLDEAGRAGEEVRAGSITTRGSQGWRHRIAYTLRIRLTNTDFNFSHVLAFSLTGAVAREVIDAYGDDTSSRPVGTGPFRLSSYTRSSKIVLEANPTYRGKIWNFTPGDDPHDKDIAARMNGKKLPQIERVEVSIMDETQSRWLAFLSGDTRSRIPACRDRPALPRAATARSRPSSRAAASGVERSVDPEITYTYFNMQEKIGDEPNPGRRLQQGKNRAAPRDRDGLQARGPDPDHPQAAGGARRVSDSAGRCGPRSAVSQAASRTRLSSANALLDKFGYKKGADGYRTLPDGKPLTIRYFVDAERARPPVRRAHEALARFDRRAAGDPQGPLPRADQAGERSAAS